MTIKNTSLQKFHFGVVDENNNPIESGLRVSVFIAGSTAATVYADAYETAMTNPVTELLRRRRRWDQFLVRSSDLRRGDQ